MNRHKIDYTVKSGLIELIIGTTGDQREEVWSNLADMAQVCAERLSKKESKLSSWTASKYPETDVRVRIDMKKHVYRNGLSFYAKIRMANDGKWESFTSDQVTEYIEKVLLGE